MAKTDLTAEELRQKFTYVPGTGVFTRPNGRAKTNVGTINAKGYRVIEVNDRPYRAHRLAWLYCFGVWPESQLDHINGDKLDNRICNLREATNSENQQNYFRAKSNNKSGLIGVSPSKDAWVATIYHNGRKHHLGRFSSPEIAHSAYVTAKREIHPFGNI